MRESRTHVHETLEGADALLILTEWDEFKSVVPATLKERLKEPLIVDRRNIYERTEMEKVGLRYIAVGC